MNQLQAVLSNCNFSLDYETGKLIPQLETILLVTQPEYVFGPDAKDLVKQHIVKQLRFTSSIAAVNELIEQLQALVQQANNMEQMAGTLNEVIAAGRGEK